MSSDTAARLHLPSAALAGCMHLAVERDTRALNLSDAQRFNFHPASPFPTIAWIFEGELRLAEPGDAAQPPGLPASLPRIFVSGPCRQPVTTWSPGPVHMLMAGFYPDAWTHLLGIGAEDHIDRILPLDMLPPSNAKDVLLRIGGGGTSPILQVETALHPLWHPTRRKAEQRDLRGWLKAAAQHAASTGTEVGTRQAQRRLRRWTGQSHRDLALFARVEDAFALGMQGPETTDGLAAIATEAGYSDQSHMGREVKRVTGMSPARFAERIATDESFWMYRLLSNHLQDQVD